MPTSSRPPAEDVMMETVVEVSTECGPIEEESFPIPSECEPAAKKKRGGQCHLTELDLDLIMHFVVAQIPIFHKTGQ